MKRKIIITDDGSTSLELLDIKEHYHSTFGAIQEAQFVYLKNGLEHIVNLYDLRTISVLEMGFGTGLNAFLSFLFAEKQLLKIDYMAIEAFPLNADEVSQLNYIQQLNAQEFASVFADFHQIKHNDSKQLTPSFKLTLNTNPLEEFEAINQFNLIYFDAFGPDVQSELWTESIFNKMYDALKPEGVLVTYSAKGSVRRTLQAVGFKVERLSGPPGKREMLRAIKV